MRPPLGPVQPLGYGCSYGISSTCGRPAAVHILWSADDGTGLACPDHWAEVARRGWLYLDAHPVCHACPCEGRWVWSEDEPPGRCESEAHPELAALAALERQDA